MIDCRLKNIEDRLSSLENELKLLKNSRQIFITLDIAAQELNISELTLRRWVEDGKVTPVITPKRQMLFTLEQIISLKKADNDGRFGLKILYADWVKNHEKMGFPKNRLNLAKTVKLGTKVLVYLTHPIKRIVTASVVTGDIFDGQNMWPDEKEINNRWPYVVPHKMLFPFKEGVTLEQAGIDYRPRPGATYLPIDEVTFERICSLLEQQSTYDWAKYLELHS